MQFIFISLSSCSFHLYVIRYYSSYGYIFAEWVVQIFKDETHITLFKDPFRTVQ